MDFGLGNVSTYDDLQGIYLNNEGLSGIRISQDQSCGKNTLYSGEYVLGCWIPREIPRCFLQHRG